MANGPSPPLRKNRDFMLLWSGQAVSNVGTQVSSIAFPLLVLALTNSPAKAGLAGFLGTLPYLLFSLPAGGLVDRWNRKRTMIICDLFRGLAVVSIPLVLWMGGLSFAQILIVAFADGTLYVLFALAESSAIPKVVPPDQLTAALGQNEARVRGASMLGRPIGGALFEMARGLPFLADAVSYGLSVVSLLFIRSEFQEARTPPERRLREEVREGLAWLWRQPFLRGTALIAAGGNLINQALTLTVIVLSKERGASPALIGLLLGFFGVGGLLGSLVAPWVQRHVGARTVVVGTIWLGGVLLALIAAIPLVLAPGPLVGLRAFTTASWNVVVMTYELTLTPDRLLGRVQGAAFLIASGSAPLGALLGGFLLQAVGAVTTTWILTAGTLVMAVAATLSPALRSPPPLRRPAIV